MNYAKLYAQVLGAVLLLVGILGFVSASPINGTTGLMPSSSELGIFPINNVHNVIHMATGLLGLFAGFSSSGAYARLYALVFGVVYTLVTVIGFVVAPGTDTHFLLGLVPLNLYDNLLHAGIAITGLAAYFLTSPQVAARTA